MEWDYNKALYVSERVCGICTQHHSTCYCLAVEGLMGLEIPRRAQVIRTIMLELERLHSHLLAVGSMAMDIGAFTPFTHAIREREYLNDLFEELCGARLTFHYMRIGGVGWDLPPGWVEKVLAFLDRFESVIESGSARC